MRRGLLVGGRETAAADGRTFAVINPATEQEIGRVADAHPDDAVAAVSAAEAAQPEWAGASPRNRAEVLRECARRISADADGMAGLLVEEAGKTLADARLEVSYTAEFFTFYADLAARDSGRLAKTPSGRWRMLVERVPAGVALLVTPWNFPAAMIGRKVAPALAAGVTTVVKPSPETPLVALRLADIIASSGLPPGTVNVIPTTRSPEVVASAMRQRPVRKLSFTGSTAVGKALLRQAADRVLDCTMELGGNAPFLVLPGADLAASVNAAADAKLRSNGQACTAANRFLVHDLIADEFVEALATRLATVVTGPPEDPLTGLGPLINAGARERVHALVLDAVERGADLVLPGGPLPGNGFFHSPAVLDHVPEAAAIISQEIFGPVAAVTRCGSTDEMIRIANDTDLGLAAYVCGPELAGALDVVRQLDVGMVGVNTGILSDPAAPFGGVKQSGIGIEGGVEGLESFTTVRYAALPL